MAFLQIDHPARFIAVARPLALLHRLIQALRPAATLTPRGPEAHLAAGIRRDLARRAVDNLLR